MTDPSHRVPSVPPQHYFPCLAAASRAGLRSRCSASAPADVHKHASHRKVPHPVCQAGSGVPAEMSPPQSHCRILKADHSCPSRHRRKNFQSGAPQNQLFPPESPPSYPRTGVHDGYPRLFQRTAAPPHDRKRPLIPGTPRVFRLFQASPPYGSPDPDRRRALRSSDTDTGGSASSSAKTARQPPAC